jgi:peptidoglycan/xylan/chitin deacetylase (PgdA/CDA1 family)
VTVWLPILAYHRICETPAEGDPLGLCTAPARLERVLEYLQSHGYRTVTFDEAAEAIIGGVRLKEKLVCLTFDDGYEDFYTNAFPLLRACGAKATVFLVAGSTGATNRWDEASGFPSTRLMTAEQVRELASQGVAFGSHTLTHPHLTRLDETAQRREILDSKRELEDLLAEKVNSFCYPHLDYNERVRALVEEAGYVSACGGEQAENSTYLLHRINVCHSNWPFTLFRIWGWRHRLQRSRRLRSLRHLLFPEAPPAPSKAEAC